MTRPLCIFVSLVLFAWSAEAGQTADPVDSPAAERPAAERPAADEEALPVAPDVMLRHPSGRVTPRAVRLPGTLRIDGQLDESVYTSMPAMSDFVQTEPKAGTLATERTDVWIFFDDDNIYVVARCWESQPERRIVHEMRRDNTTIGMGDNFAWTFDTFHDRRNGIMFEANPIGGRMDGQTTNEDATNFDWNPVWDFAVGRFEGGWTLETSLPFKSLRYRPGQAQVWGFNARRTNKWKNEVSYLSPIPAAFGARGLRPALAATLIGVEAPPGSKNLEIKPYATSNLTSDTTVRPRISNQVDADIGLDVKYGVTQNLTADFTYNTDFAQVEADEQQVNLTRFNLLFPEKREFFLENRGTFGFGGEAAGDTPLIFYSRRIGLNNGRLVPIRTGGRLTGRVGRFTLGMLNIQTDEEAAAASPATNFSVVRVKRDIFRQSSIGLMYTGRSVASNGVGPSQAYGVDGNFTFLSNKLTINSYWARTRNDDRSGEDTSYRGQLDYDEDRYGVTVERLVVGDNFRPDIGFVRRDDMARSYGRFRFSPRPSSDVIRKLSWAGSAAYIEDGAGRLETRELNGEFGIEFENSDRFLLGYASTYESLALPFPIAPGITVPVGGYDFASARTSYTFGTQRALSGAVSLEHGSFYDGDKTAVGVTGGRVKFTPKFSAQPTYTINRVELIEGAFTSHLLGSRITYTMTPAMFTSALLQYNSTGNLVSANVRFRWEYHPGSELFVVLNEQRDTMTQRFPTLANRAFVIKMTRLLRF